MGALGGHPGGRWRRSVHRGGVRHRPGWHSRRRGRRGGRGPSGIRPPDHRWRPARATRRRHRRDGEATARHCRNHHPRDGGPIRISQTVQTQVPLAVAHGFAAALDSFEFEERIGNSLVVREPYGVVAAITPWNYPLYQVVAKVLPAIAAGCTVVLKPSNDAPLSVFEFVEALQDAGLPPGVVNLVSGPGSVIGERMAQHPDVDLVSFTGSTGVGSRVGELAGKTVKKVALELGGKSANVILDGADLAAAVKVGVGNAFLNGGQTCMAWTRMLVPDRATTRHWIWWRPRCRNTPSGTHGIRTPGSGRRRRHRNSGPSSDSSSVPSVTAPDFWSAVPKGPRRRLLRPADGVRRCRPRLRTGPGGGLRSGSRRDPVQRQRRCVAHRQRHPVRPVRRGVGRRRRDRGRVRPPGAKPVNSTSTAESTTRRRRSAATRSRASAANSAGSASRSTSRSSPLQMNS